MSPRFADENKKESGSAGTAFVDAGAEIAARNRTREILRMSGTANVLGPVREGGRAMLPLARRKTPRPARRILAADQLMAPPCEVVLPTLEKVPTEQRFSADDSEIIALAEILVKTDIAVAEDWEKSGRDATKYLLLTLQRWIRDHGGASIQRRFDLDLTLSDRLVDYSDERGPEGTLYLIVDPEGAAFVLLNPAIELLGSDIRVCPRHFSGILSDPSTGGCGSTTTTMPKSESTCCASGTRAKRMPSSTKCRTSKDVPQKCLKERPLGLRGLKELSERYGTSK